MEHEPLSSEPVDPVLEQSRLPVPPGWSESTGYPSWLPSAPWKIDGDPDDVPGDGKHWESARKLVEDFDAATVAGWKDEVQTQLLVASLLAAVTGAFVIETQKQLSEDPAVTTAFILTQIVMQLNQSMVIPATTVAPFDRPSSTSRAVNSLYFASLGFSLSNVTIGLLCLQWLRGLAAQPQGIPAQTFLLFRLRRDRAFQEWGAKGMILTLPLLLLASLVLFFVALLISTSSVDWVVATPVYIILISALIVLLFTTFAPGAVTLWFMVFSDTWPETTTFPPFHSLQSWVIFQGLLKFKLLLEFIFDLSREVSLPVINSAPDWVTVDQFWADWSGSPTQRRISTLFPLALSFGKKKDRDALYHCYNDLFPSHAVTPGRRRLEVYRHMVEQVQKDGTTLLQVQNQLVHQIAALLNSGKRLQDLGSLQVEFSMNHYFISADTLLQVVHALIQSITREPFSAACRDNWVMLWSLATHCLIHGDEPDLCQPWTVPALFKNIFDLVEPNLVYHQDTTLGAAFAGFIYELLFRIVGMASFFKDHTVGRSVVNIVVHHPVYPKLCEMAQANHFGEGVFEIMQLLSAHASQFPKDDLYFRFDESGSRTPSPSPHNPEHLRNPDKKQSEHQGTLSTGTSSATILLHPQQNPPSQSLSDSPYPQVDPTPHVPVGPSGLHDITLYSPLHDGDDQRKVSTVPDDPPTKQPPLSSVPSQLPPTVDLVRLPDDVGHPALSGGSAIVFIDARDSPDEHSPPPHSVLDIHESTGQEWIGLASRSSRTRSPDVESGQTPMDQIRDI